MFVQQQHEKHPFAGRNTQQKLSMLLQKIVNFLQWKYLAKRGFSVAKRSRVDQEVEGLNPAGAKFSFLLCEMAAMPQKAAWESKASLQFDLTFGDDLLH